jgi:hypothetical protein
MKRRAWRSVLVAAVGGLCLAGCSNNKSAVNQQVRDPLLISKKPVEGRADRPTAPQVAFAEPSPPPAPEAAVATAPVKLDPLVAGRLEPAAAPPLSKPPVSATPAVRTGNGPPPTETVSRSGPAAIYGHSPDHAWLQGVIDKHYHGHLELRYRDPSEEDDWGGKVILEDDPRLAQVKDGDVVRVEGEIVKEDGNAKRGLWNHFVLYRVKDVRVIQSK